ncbi:MAG: glycosyltransferase family 9 protein, partial [Ignavibacteria bacterium]
HVLAKAVFSPKKANYPFHVSKGTKILFLRHDGLGDMICTLPMFQKIRDHYPYVELHVMCTNANVSFIAHCDFIDHIHIVDKNIQHSPFLFLSVIRKIRNYKYDMIINCLTSKASKNGILTSLLSHPITLSSSVYFGNQYEVYFSAQSQKAASEESMWDKMLMLAIETFGLDIETSTVNPILPSLPQHVHDAQQTIMELGLTEKRFIAINISVGQTRNQWNIESYVSLINYIIKSGKEPLLFAIQKDFYFIELIQQYVPSVQYYPIGRHILEVGEALTYAALTISPDTGFLHLASVAKCPVIGLYCALSEDVKNEWAPFRVQHIRIFSETDKVSDISEQLVIDAFIKLEDMLNHL